MYGAHESLKNTSSSDDISLDHLEHFFRNKFESDTDCNVSDVREHAKMEVDTKYETVLSTTPRDKVISPSMVRQYIKSLNSGCSPGIDGIQSEHLKHAIDSSLPVLLSCMLTLCVQFHVVPVTFTRAVIVPLLKKPTLDPSIPNNYRPVSVSSTLSKLMELHILAQCEQHEASDLQFGFVPGRSTNMAAALTQDVITYCNSRGSTVYACSLDAQGAFDAVPHEILFHKAMNVIPDDSWAMMVTWYRSITVQVKWGNELSKPILILKGTRQGGLSSPFLFNLFYKDLIDRLSVCTGGVRIGDSSFNVFCYADDILLCSLTVTGLQRLIDVANMYISSHGLCFNPTKTECIIFGPRCFTSDPKWYLNGVSLGEMDMIKYLGVNLSYVKRKSHCENRMSACRRAFYSLQGAGLCNSLSDVNVASYVFNSAIRPVLLYGLNTCSINKGTLRELEKLQGRLIKSMVGTHKYCKTTPILKALGICSIESTVDTANLELLRSVFSNKSRARCFYLFLLNKMYCNRQSSSHFGLLHRVRTICSKYSINFLQYIFDGSYSSRIRGDIKRSSLSSDGLSDSVRQLLLSYDPYDKVVLNMLLTPF